MDKCVPKIMFAALVTLAMAATSAAVAQDGGNAVPRPGQTVDATGNAAVDPTKNVLDLVLAAVKRLDDMSGLALKRQDDLRQAQATLEELRYAGLKENAAIRAEYEGLLRRAEAGRLDALRIVDTNNVTVANERALATASALQKKGDDSALVLSAQVTKSADDVRTLVKTTADEQSRNLQQQFAGIQTQFTNIGSRLTTLEQTGAEGLGKQKFQDPAQAAVLATLTEEVRKISRSQADSGGVGQGRSDVFGWIGIAIGIGIAFATFLFNVLRSKPTRR